MSTGRPWIVLLALALPLALFPIGAGEKDKPKVDIVQTFKGHGAEIYSVALSRDGKHLVTGSFDNTVRLWDTATGKEIRTFAGPQGHTKQVLSVAVNGEGRLIASGGADNTLKVWDVPVDRAVRSLALNDAGHAVALSPDGLKLAVGSKDGKLRLVNAADFKDLFKLEPGHDGPVTGLGFSANNALLVSAGADRTLRYWNATNGQLIAVVGGHTGPVNGIALHPANNAVFSVGDDGFVKFWTFNPAASRPLPGHAGVIRAMALSADGGTVLTAGDDKVIRQTLIAGKEVRTIAGLSSTVRSLALGNFIAAGMADGKLALFDAKEGKPAGTHHAHGGAVTDAAFHPTAAQVATAGDDGLVKIWALPPAPPRALAHPDAVLVAAASADGKKYFTGGADKIVRVWDPGKPAIERQFSGHAGAVTALASSGQSLVSGGGDGSIRFWNLATGKDAEILLGHAATVTSLAFHPAGSMLASASEDGSVRLWRLPVAAPKPMVHPDQVTCLALSADGTKMATGSADKQVRLWNLAAAAKERDFPGPALAITAVAMTPDARLIAAGSADKSLTVWSADGKQIHKVALPAAVQAVALSVDGKVAAAGLGDGGIKLFGTGDGKEIKSVAGHKGAVTALAYGPKGDLLISSSADRTIRIMNAADGAVRSKLEHAGPVVGFALNKEGTRLAALADKSVKLWNVADGKEAGSFSLSFEARGIAFAPDGSRIVLGGEDKLARIVERDGQLVESFAQEGPVHAVGFLDGSRIVAAGADKTARLWTSSLVWHGKHAGPVRQTQFSPKGDQVLSAGDDKNVKVFNAADGKAIRTLAAHDGPIAGFAISPDGARLITASADKTLKTWSFAKPEDTKPASVIALPVAPTSVAINVAGNRLAIGAGDGQVRVFDPGLGREVQTLAEHAGAIKSLVFLGDNRTLLSAAADKTARLLDVAVVASFEAHKEGVVSLQYHAGGTQMLTAGKDRTVKLWDLAKNAVVKTFGPLADDIHQATYSRDFTLIGAAAGKSVKAWNIADGKEIASLGHPANVLSLAFNQDRTRIVTGSADKQTRLWDVATGKELQFFPQEDAVVAVQFDAKGAFVVAAAGKAPRVDTPAIMRQVHADKGPLFSVAATATHVLTGGADRTGKLWNVANGNLERSFPGGAEIRALALNKAGQLVAMGGPDQVVRLFNFADGKELGAAKTGGAITALAFAPNNAVLAATSADRTLQTWSVPFTPGMPPAKDFLTPIQTFAAADVLRDIVFAGDNATIYSASLDKNMHVWKLASPSPVASFPHPNLVDCVAFQPPAGGSLVASGGHDGKIRLFDLVKKAQVKEINAHTAKEGLMIYSLVFTPDGKQILSAGYDNSLKLFDVASGNLVREFKAFKAKEFDKGHTEPVFSAAFSPDGKFLASGSSGLERVIKIWNVADGSVVRDLENPAFKAPPMTPVQSHPNRVYQLRFTGDGKLISIGDAPVNKGYLAVWSPMDGKLLYGETLPLGCFYGLDVNADGSLLAIGAGPNRRVSPEFDTAYLIRMPVR